MDGTLDVHRDFCEVTTVEQRQSVRSAGSVATTPETLTLFAQSLGPDAHVVLEATANALAIARLLRPHVARVVLTAPSAVHELGPRRPPRSTLARWPGCWPAASPARCGRPTTRQPPSAEALAPTPARQAAHAREEQDPRGADAKPKPREPMSDLFGSRVVRGWPGRTCPSTSGARPVYRREIS